METRVHHVGGSSECGEVLATRKERVVAQLTLYEESVTNIWFGQSLHSTDLDRIDRSTGLFCVFKCRVLR